MEFMKAVNALLPSAHLKYGAADLLEGYSNFVWHCETGYPTDYEAYSNQRSYRNWLEIVLSAQELQGYEELVELRRLVSALDDRLRALLLPGAPLRGRTGRWWEVSVPKRGGLEFANSVKEQFGLAIEVAD